MYDREEYEWYKTHGICVRCRKAKARRGRTTCAECAAQNTERTLALRCCDGRQQLPEKQPPK